jgi:hypothetical protein
MKTVNTMSSMLAAAEAESAKQLTEKKKEIAAKIEIATAYDAVIANLAEPLRVVPDFVHVWNLHGTRASIHFKEVIPGDALALMRALPAVPTVLYRDGHVSMRPTSSVTTEMRMKDKTDTKEANPFRFTFDKYSHGQTRCKVEWFADLAGVLVCITVELLSIHGITPEMRGRVSYYGNSDAIASIEHIGIAYPLNKPAGMQEIRYGRVDNKSWNSFIHWSHAGEDCVTRAVQAMADECLRRHTQSREAYELDKASGIDPEPAKPYGQSGSLRAGTEAQHNCLNSEAARRDYALANKHWRMYAEDLGIKTEQGYMDHYTWACTYLARHGLNPDPNGPDGKPYKYGSAWL